MAGPQSGLTATTTKKSLTLSPLLPLFPLPEGEGRGGGELGGGVLRYDESRIFIVNCGSELESQSELNLAWRSPAHRGRVDRLSDDAELARPLRIV